MNEKPKAVAAPAVLRRWMNLATEPHILYPAIAIVLLAVIWGLTLNLLRVERVAAEQSARESSQGLGETYEAQVVRALREIDQTLKVVKYAYELRGQPAALLELKAQSLLPADRLFVVSIADIRGAIVASTRQAETSNVLDEDYFQAQILRDAPAIGRPRRSAASGEWRLHFSRRLRGPDGDFAGIAMVAIDAAYFVSGYETSKLGQNGVLALLGTDGVFRARRTGDQVFAGVRVDFGAVVPLTDDANATGVLVTNPWDGVRRYTSARQLYEFPVAVVVGLSEEEQLAPTRRNMQTSLWRAFGGSAVVIAVLTVLGRMSRQLAITRRRTVEVQLDNAARVEHLAYHDGLTGLPNRSLFSKLLVQSINQSRRYKRQLAVLFLDLDRFKDINDTLGHESGDQLLKEMAARLKGCLRDSDTVARLGGDEFVVMLPELDAQRNVAEVARKILSAAAAPFMLLGQEFRVTASIGISLYPQDGLDEQTLTKNADIAMYQAKEEGKNGFRFYSRALTENSLERLTLESGLRHALERNEFELHYQAKRDIRSGRITGMEALLRWSHPDLGIVAPMQFLPVAEETGLIVPIGRWVLRTACLQNVAWQKQGLPHLSVAVNLSVRQVYDENLLAMLAEVLAETGMAAPLLELEFTESLLMRDVDRALRILTELKGMGVHVGIDDFGVGYASLAKLKRFPLDTIKIDRSFIHSVSSVEGNEDLTEAILEMGRALSLNVVAQGVETKEQADFVRRNEQGEFQGFYLNRPVPAQEFANLLRAQLSSAA